MEKEIIQTIIESYIDAYNKFDVAGMLKSLHPDVEFKNITAGNVDLSLTGLKEFGDQANSALQYFSERKQTISGLNISDHTAEVSVDYQAILAIDLPNGLKAGESIQMKGQSVFIFEDNLILSITDIS